MSPEPLLTIKELSAWLGVPVPTLYLWKHLRKIPFVKVRRLLRFDRREIDKWLAEGRVHAVSTEQLARETSLP